jgi:glycosyltransferase involved in cell wall biosynthesis
MAEPTYRGFDVFALSSDTEQMPLSVLEAMAASLPVAATDVGDVAGMLADDNRPFVTALDPAALAAALKTLLERPDLRRALGAANRARAERDYDEAAMLRGYADLFGAPS